MKTEDLFLERVRARLKKGAAEYGDESFNKPPEVLRQEILEEIEDICGWAYVLWVRVQKNL